MSQTPIQCRSVRPLEKASAVGAEIGRGKETVRGRIPVSHVDSNIGPESPVYINGEFPVLISVKLALKSSTSFRRTYGPVSTIIRQALESVSSPYDAGLNTTEAFRVPSDMSTGSSQRTVQATAEPDFIPLDSSLLGYREDPWVFRVWPTR